MSDTIYELIQNAKEASFTINDIMDHFGLSIKEVSEKFEIPYRTVQNWAGGVSTPPPYVISMIWLIICDEDIIEYSKRENKRLNDILDRASDLLHDDRYKEATSLIDNA